MRHILLLLFLPLFLPAQTITTKIQELQHDYEELAQQQKIINLQIETLKLQQIRVDLKAIGLPSDNYIEHNAMMLEYSEEHEQPKWVAHIITPDIIKGVTSRTNDFRVDPKVTTGTATEADYFLKALQPDSSYVYDGFGYDRGHLAPSADFRWSYLAVSESYFYSNISPQLDQFNREKWAELEALLRGYLYLHPTHQLYVVTLPVLEEGLPVIERGLFKVSIPRQFVKVAIDPIANKGIAFVMLNKKLDSPLMTYAVTIDEAEVLTGYDFFNNLDVNLEKEMESAVDTAYWFPGAAQGDVEPLYPPDLPPGHFNTVQAKMYVDKRKEVIVCGKVVSSRTTRKGNVMLNLDKGRPHEIFSVFIPKAELVNFSYNPVEALLNGIFCFKGQVKGFMGWPVMEVETEKKVKAFEGE